MKKFDVVKTILGERLYSEPRFTSVKTFAPTNIALCKYWGKRNQEINLPVTSSLSISLGEKGAHTELSVSETDNIFLNDQPVSFESSFAKRLIEFLNLFRPMMKINFHVRTKSNIPIAAGLASSACGFASVIQALDKLFDWKLKPHELSILARLGSGSASRSLWQGFVEWHAGIREDGMDSFAEPLMERWPAFCIGLLIVSEKEKMISSRVAMQRTVTTSPLYSGWPLAVDQAMNTIKQVIFSHDFNLLGKSAEANALTMHATMLSAWPPVLYALPETVEMMKKIWELRNQGLEIYFTQDAGPNLKLIFLAKDEAEVIKNFSNIEIINPFS